MLDAYPPGSTDTEYLLDDRTVLAIAFEGVGRYPDVAFAEPVSTAQMLEQLRVVDSPFGSLDGTTVDALRRITINNGRLMHDFEPRRFSGDLLLFQAGRDDDADRLTGTDPRDVSEGVEAWRPYVGGEILSHVVDCAHAEMTGAAALAVIGPIVAAALRAQRSGVRAL
jgi:pristinamycin I synthase-3/4